MLDLNSEICLPLSLPPEGLKVCAAAVETAVHSENMTCEQNQEVMKKWFKYQKCIPCTRKKQKHLDAGGKMPLQHPEPFSLDSRDKWVSGFKRWEWHHNSFMIILTVEKLHHDEGGRDQVKGWDDAQKSRKEMKKFRCQRQWKYGGTDQSGNEKGQPRISH